MIPPSSPDGPTDQTVIGLSPRQLRYLLTLHLLDAQRSGVESLTVADLVRRVHDEGFTVPRRASKTVSDALRWEIGRHRVVRLARGRYGIGTIPRSTLYRMRLRVGDARSRLPPDRAGHS